MTPFWRAISLRPIGASCRENSECVTMLCRYPAPSTAQAQRLSALGYAEEVLAYRAQTRHRVISVHKKRYQERGWGKSSGPLLPAAQTEQSPSACTTRLSATQNKRWLPERTPSSRRLPGNHLETLKFNLKADPGRLKAYTN